MGWFRHNHDRCCEEFRRELEQMHLDLRTQRLLVYDILADTRVIVGLLRPRLSHLTIIPQGAPMSLDVGKTAVATVNGFDQFGQPFPIDFAANPPAWSVSDPNVATLAADPTAGSEDVTGTAVGHETLSVTVAGLTATLDFDVVAPASVLSKVTITTNPPV